MTLRYRAVLFDLDGTLVDSYAALAEAVNHARRAHGLHELSAGRIRDFVGDGLETMLQRAFETENVPRSAKMAFEERYDQICCAKSRVLDDVEETVAALHARGVAMAVCTNKPTVSSTSSRDRKSTRLNSSHRCISYAVFCLKKKKAADADAHAK